MFWYVVTLLAIGVIIITFVFLLKAGNEPVEVEVKQPETSQEAPQQAPEAQPAPESSPTPKATPQPTPEAPKPEEPDEPDPTPPEEPCLRVLIVEVDCASAR